MFEIKYSATKHCVALGWSNPVLAYCVTLLWSSLTNQSDQERLLPYLYSQSEDVHITYMCIADGRPTFDLSHGCNRPED